MALGMLALAGLGMGANLVGSYMQSQGSKEAIRAQARANEKLKGDLTDTYTSGFKDINQMYQPLSSLVPGALQGMQQDYSVDPTNFQYGGQVEDFLDPSIDYQVQQAGRGIEAGASARGGLLSGATQKALSDRAQSIGQMGYSDAQNRMMQDKLFAFNQANQQYQQQVQQGQTQYGQQQNLANIGMQGINQQANARQNMTSGIGSGIAGVGTNPQTAGMDQQFWGGQLSQFANPENIMSMGKLAGLGT